MADERLTNLENQLNESIAKHKIIKQKNDAKIKKLSKEKSLAFSDISEKRKALSDYKRKIKIDKRFSKFEAFGINEIDDVLSMVNDISDDFIDKFFFESIYKTYGVDMVGKIKFDCDKRKILSDKVRGIIDAYKYPHNRHDKNIKYVNQAIVLLAYIKGLSVDDIAKETGYNKKYHVDMVIDMNMSRYGQIVAKECIKIDVADTLIKLENDISDKKEKEFKKIEENLEALSQKLNDAKDKYRNSYNELVDGKKVEQETRNKLLEIFGDAQKEYNREYRRVNSEKGKIINEHKLHYPTEHELIKQRLKEII